MDQHAVPVGAQTSPKTGTTPVSDAPPYAFLGGRLRAVQRPDRAHHDQPWTLCYTLRVSLKTRTLAIKRTGQKYRATDTEAKVVVPIVSVVPVTVGGTQIPGIVVVPGTAAQHTGLGRFRRSGVSDTPPQTGQ